MEFKLNDIKPIYLIAITGASGGVYGLRLIEVLLQQGFSIYLIISKAGQMVLRSELNLDIPTNPKAAEQWLLNYFQIQDFSKISVFGRQDWFAPFASGSNPPAAMIVCPCTSGTLAAIANGLSQNLIGRAADVMIKEHKKLILVIRETPFSTIHLKNMLALTETGVIIMPANPGFYHQPKSIKDMIDFMIARILDQLGISHQLMKPWGE